MNNKLLLCLTTCSLLALGSCGNKEEVCKQKKRIEETEKQVEAQNGRYPKVKCHMTQEGDKHSVDIVVEDEETTPVTTQHRSVSKYSTQLKHSVDENE